MTDPTSGLARPATVEDLKLLLRALDEHGVDYVLIGGYALCALGYQRGTVDIDLMLRATREQGEKTKRALSVLPDGVADELDPDWFIEGETIRVADAFVVDLMFNACGETYESLTARDHHRLRRSPRSNARHRGLAKDQTDAACKG